MYKHFSSTGVAAAAPSAAMEAVNHSKNSAMEAENHVKHGAVTSGYLFRKATVLLLVATLTASYAQAQFGVRAGLNFSQLSLLDYDGEDNYQKLDGWESTLKPGFQIGIVYDLFSREKFAIQPGLIFATQGGIIRPDDEDVRKAGYVERKINLNNLQIPVNLQLKMNVGSAKLLLQAGPYLGFGINGKETTTNVSVNGGITSRSNQTILTFKYNDDDIEEANNFQYHLRSMNIGVGFGVGLQSGNIQAGVGYNLGLNNLQWGSASGGNPLGVWRCNDIALTVTYLFGNRNSSN